jgi:hypothetical protein
MDEKLPRYAILKNRGRVRIIDYKEGTQTFVVLTNKDEQVWCNRSQLTFLKQK